MHYRKKKTGKKRTWMWGDFPATKKERKTCSGQSTLSHCMMSMMKAVSRFWHEYQLKVAALVLLSSVNTTKYFLFNKNALGLKGSLSILRAFWRRQHGRKTKNKKKQTNPNSLFAVWLALLGEIDVITLWLYATLQVLGGFYLFIFISAHTHDFLPWVNAAVLCSS